MARPPSKSTLSYSARAEQALEEERQRQAREPAAEATRKPTTETPTRRVLGVLGAKASGFF